ncbi:hypothetical protein KAS31_01975 [Candidatus Parcubacteria bacterium]|nr:hypothetical protein [Candidatus Parcubacteria bacterium]MCK5085284.1 hypothetical protein [Candidatus Parcubacteria bacterium]
MKKIIIVIVLLLILVIAGYGQYGSFGKSNQKVDINLEKNNKNQVMFDADQTVDKLEIYYFHRTQRCYSCNTFSRYTGEVINQKFSEEIKNGKIDFREINVDLPENKDVVRKFQASGLALFINAIRDGEDDISQDTKAWRLLNNEAQFKKYLEDKINVLLEK